MGSYNDERNWDQEELDRAREVAKDNVVSEGGNVPQAAKIRSEEVLPSQEPSEVLQGERFSTEKERELVESGATTNDEDPEAARSAGAKNFERNRKAEEKESK